MPIRFDEFLAIVKAIKNARSFEEAWDIYVKYYLKPSFDLTVSALQQAGVKLDPEALWRIYSEKVREHIFKHVYNLMDNPEESKAEFTVRYPPEVKYLYLLAFGSRVPLMMWSTLPKEERVPKLKQAFSLLGPAACVAVRGCAKIWMIDIDVNPAAMSQEDFAKLCDLVRKAELPFCRSWGGGLNIFMPISESAYPKGAKLRIRAKMRDPVSGREYEIDYTFTQRCGIKILLGVRKMSKEVAVGFAGLEILIDFIYVWPRQSWIWYEADRARAKVRKVDTITTVTFVRKAVDLSAVSYNWLVLGIPYSVDNPTARLRRLIEDLITEFDGYLMYGSRLVKTGEGIAVERPRVLVDFDIEVEKREVAVEEEVRGRGEEIGFREHIPDDLPVPYGGGTAFVVEARSETRFTYSPLYDAVYWPDQGELILQVCGLADEKEVLPHCVRYFVLQTPPDDVTKFDLNIVGWFMMRQLFPVYFYEDEARTREGREKWRSRVKPLVEQASRIKKLDLRWYYYEKFNSIGRPPSDVFLKDSHEAVLLSSVCSECPYRHICSVQKKSASAKLIDVANEVAYASFHDKELRDYLHPVVIDRILAGKKPLPRVVADDWVLRKLEAKKSAG